MLELAAQMETDGVNDYNKWANESFYAINAPQQPFEMTTDMYKNGLVLALTKLDNS